MTIKAAAAAQYLQRNAKVLYLDISGLPILAPNGGVRGPRIPPPDLLGLGRDAIGSGRGIHVLKREDVLLQGQPVLEVHWQPEGRGVPTSGDGSRINCEEK